MTVSAWVELRAVDAPAALRRRLVAALGNAGLRPEHESPRACLRAAEALLDDLLAGERFARDGAADLLTIDALTTVTFEHSEDADELEQLAAEALERIGRRVTSAAS